MKFKFHHMNLCTENVPRIGEFYRSLFGMDPVNGYVRVDGATSYGGAVEFVTDGAVEFHLARRDVELGFRMKHFVNPLDRAISASAPTTSRASGVVSTRRRFPIPTTACGRSRAGTRSSSTTPTATSSRSTRPANNPAATGVGASKKFLLVLLSPASGERLGEEVFVQRKVLISRIFSRPRSPLA